MVGLNLPTDNLYKFIAIAGVTIALFSIYLMFTRVEQGTARVDQLARASTLLLEEANQIELAWERLKEKKGPKARSLEDARNEIKKRKAQMHEDAQAGMRVAEFNLWLFKELRIASWVGFVLAVLGFYFWYFKIQKYLDIAIKNQKLT